MYKKRRTYLTFIYYKYKQINKCLACCLNSVKPICDQSLCHCVRVYNTGYLVNGCQYSHLYTLTMIKKKHYLSDFI